MSVFARAIWRLKYPVTTVVPVVEPFLYFEHSRSDTSEASLYAIDHLNRFVKYDLFLPNKCELTIELMLARFGVMHKWRTPYGSGTGADPAAPGPVVDG